MGMTLIPRACPWPGPRPYGTDHARFFFGRNREVTQMCTRVVNNRLTILSGASGAGKTSLLRAGVQKRLIAERELGKRETGRVEPPPALLLRGWAATHAESVERLFVSSVQDAIEDLNDLSPDDYRLLAAVPATGAFFDYVVDLCDAAGGVILLFDQFEEVLRAGKHFVAEAVKLAVDLYRFERRALLLLSLREEHLKDLRELDSYVQGLLNAAYYLPLMQADTVGEALTSAASAAGMRLDKSALEMILDWVRHGLQEAGQCSGSQTRTIDPSTDSDPVDLLTLQTILFELCEHLRKQSMADDRDSKPVAIEVATLEEYRGDRDLDVLVGEALERWIERSLGVQEESGLGESAGIISQLPGEQLSGAVRRAGSRMGPLLSSGGFKTAAEEQDFMWGVIRNDLRTLRPDLDREAIRLLSPTGTPPRLDRDLLGLSEEHTETTKESLSAFSRKLRWSPADTADAIVQLFFETLRRLGDGNVVKRIGIGTENNWELVHDGLGRPLTRWGEKQESSWQNSVFALTASRGETIGIHPSLGTQTLPHMVWQGCSIRPVKDAVLEAVVFDECDLRGTVFRNCTFLGGSFNECVLDGVVFIDCKFSHGPDDAPVVFRHCKQTATLTFRGRERSDGGSSMEGIRFESCTLDALGMVGIRLDGPVHFTGDTELFRAYFSGLSVGSSGEGRLEFAEGCQLEFCAWDEQSEDLIVPRPHPDWPKSGVRRSERAGSAD